MRSIIENLSKEIIAARESEKAGIVTNVYVDEKLSRIRGYKVSDEESDRDKMLPMRRVIGEGDALVVVNRSALSEVSFPVCPLGAKIYDTCGMMIGTLRDLHFDERGQVHALLSDNGEISPERVLSIGSDLVVLRAPAHQGKAFRRASAPGARRSTPRKAKKLPTVIGVNEDAFSPEILEERETLATGEETLLHDYAFLLGRKVRKDITSGDISVASADELVTPDVILRAHRNGKLVELTVNSRK